MTPEIRIGIDESGFFDYHVVMPFMSFGRSEITKDKTNLFGSIGNLLRSQIIEGDCKVNVYNMKGRKALPEEDFDQIKAEFLEFIEQQH